ncbi:spermidine synthase [Pedosphaera parvula Ellin514]|uniref:Spermidine synthase n=2 Tax=Pedosphaera TaxID=1032526 RepID=B9XES8_PEDPL|nr:spermidine synthase [Pedosphaera parvula Ellin514]
MNSTIAASELALGELACARLIGQAAPCILIGGLGLGFTLKSVLKQTGPEAGVEVVELIPEVVEWNRKFLAHVNGTLLDDVRVRVSVEDVWEVLARAGREKYDALVMDIDNGPSAMVHKQNARLYSRTGLQRIAAALKPGGRAAFWSARADRIFAEHLARTGLRVEAVPAKMHANAKRCAYTVYVADK